MNLTPTRRRFLRSIGLVTAASALPFHRGILRAQPKLTIPKRFVGLKYCNGIRPSRWWPTDERKDFALTPSLMPLLAPLDPVHRKLNMFRNMSLSASIGPGGSHDAGMFTFLSGVEKAAGGGLTLDQYIAKNSPVSQVPSVQLATRPGVGPYISYRGPNQPIYPVASPAAAFDAAFMDVVGAESPAVLARMRADRRSILDFVAGDIRQFQSTLGREDQVRLEFHAQSIRELEQSLAAPLASCAVPSRPAEFQGNDDNDVQLISELHLKLLVTMLTCRITHVATHIWGSGAGHFTLPAIGVSLTVHDASHGTIDPNFGRSVHDDVIRWHMEQIASFLTQLDAVVEEDGATLLDHSAVLIGTDNGAGHSIDNVPFVLAGSAGGSFRTGRCITCEPKTPHNRLLMALAEAFVEPVKSFGDPKYCDGGALTGLA